MESPAFIKRLFAKAPIAGSKADRHTRKTVALCHALLSERGEASGAALAREALAAYGELSGPALTAFFDVLAQEFSPDPEAVEAGRRRLPAGCLAGQPDPAAARGRVAAAGAVPPLQPGRRRDCGPGGNAPARVARAAHAIALGRHRRRSGPPARLLVQPRLPLAAAHRLAHPGAGAGKAHAIRGRAPDPGLARPAPPAASPTAAATLFSILPCPTSPSSSSRSR